MSPIVTTLHCAGNKIGAAGITSLATALQHCTNLTFLNLNGAFCHLCLSVPPPFAHLVLSPPAGNGPFAPAPPGRATTTAWEAWEAALEQLALAFVPCHMLQQLLMRRKQRCCGVWRLISAVQMVDNLCVCVCRYGYN